MLFATGPRIDLVIEGSLLFLALAAIRPALSLAVVAGTLPFYPFPQGAPLSPGLTETALIWSAGGVGLRWALERTGRLKPTIVLPRPTRFDWPIAALLAAGLSSLLVSQYLHLSLRELRALLLEPILYFYLLAAVLRERAEIRRVVEAFLLASFAVALLGVAQSLLGFQATQAEGVQRAVGTFGSPNHLGLHLGRAAPFLVAGLLWYGGLRRWAYGLGFLGVAAGLVATFSIGAWLAVAAAVGAVGVAHGRVFPARRRRIVAVAAVLALVSLAAAIPLLGTERFASHLDLSGGTTFFRLQLWRASLAMALDHPILGVGLDNFLYLYQQRYLLEPALEEPNLSHPHNLALHFWLQLGVLGLGGALWLLGRFFTEAHHVFYGARSRTVRALSLGAAASMVDFLVHGLVDNSYFLPDLAYVFWMSMGLAQVLAARELVAAQPAHQQGQLAEHGTE